MILPGYSANQSAVTDREIRWGRRGGGRRRTCRRLARYFKHRYIRTVVTLIRFAMISYAT
jgi:hypothetical protein